jgi:hypothetical protein
MKKIVVFFLLLFLCANTKVSAQFNVIDSFPALTSVPPYYSGQPTAVALSYYWFDHAMRTNNTLTIDSFFAAMQYSDTAKYIADAIYRVTDDNPISFYQWCDRNAVIPDPYFPRCIPGEVFYHFMKRYALIRQDTGRDEFLLTANLIAHIKVTDTTSVIASDPLTHMVHVYSQIQDEIKGQYIPNCPYDTLYSAKPRGIKPLSYSSYSHADSGTCFTFQYAKEWDHVPVTDERNVAPFGDWIKPDSEYIVFIGFESYGSDLSKSEFIPKPLWGMFGFSGGMYQVHSGIVSDPNDDFGIGASSGLTVSEWKTRLRARINKLINP